MNQWALLNSSSFTKIKMSFGRNGMEIKMIYILVHKLCRTQKTNKNMTKSLDKMVGTKSFLSATFNSISHLENINLISRAKMNTSPKALQSVYPWMLNIRKCLSRMSKRRLLKSTHLQHWFCSNKNMKVYKAKLNKHMETKSFQHGKKETMNFRLALNMTHLVI